jgi:hypothetical protein
MNTSLVERQPKLGKNARKKLAHREYHASYYNALGGELNCGGDEAAQRAAERHVQRRIERVLFTGRDFHPDGGTITPNFHGFIKHKFKQAQSKATRSAATGMQDARALLFLAEKVIN